jgi:hypothetical protein
MFIMQAGVTIVTVALVSSILGINLDANLLTAIILGSLALLIYFGQSMRFILFGDLFCRILPILKVALSLCFY